MDKRGKNIPGLIFVISGPSGSGKTTLLDRLLKERTLSNVLAKSISFTTRPRRTNERKNKDYFFISQREFIRLKREKKILEWTRYLGYYYATPRGFVESCLKKGKNLCLCLDFKGARAIKKSYPKNTVTIFVAPPSEKALYQRIEKRCSKTDKEEISKRLALGKKELVYSRNYDYRLLNKNLGQAVKGLRNIILKELRSRRG